MRVSIPLRKFRKLDPSPGGLEGKDVSIPLRKFRKSHITAVAVYCRSVSIPLRKFRKLQLLVGVLALHGGFPSL